VRDTSWSTIRSLCTTRSHKKATWLCSPLRGLCSGISPHFLLTQHAHGDSTQFSRSSRLASANASRRTARENTPSSPKKNRSELSAPRRASFFLLPCRTWHSGTARASLGRSVSGKASLSSSMTVRKARRLTIGSLLTRSTLRRANNWEHNCSRTSCPTTASAPSSISFDWSHVQS